MQSKTTSESIFTFRDEALPFIVYDQDQRKFLMTKEATDFLKEINGPIGVVAVAGMYRTGKSYLLNRMLLNRSNGFGVGPTINPCTKGLWVWGKPIQGFTPDNEPINVLIVDTEGLGALDEDSNHDVRIFSLAILLSSFFIYNSVGSIDESALQNLSLVINLTKHIHIKSRGSDDVDTEEYGAYFPSFMWVVRDFTLQLVDQEGEPISSKDYLEKALEIQKGFSDNVEQKNRIRRLMKQFFKERDCCTMIRPLTNEENLQNLANMDLDELRADFVEQVMTLRRKVINRVKPKMLNGRKLTGPMLATLAESYVIAINNGAVPSIENAWSYICKNECHKAIEEALLKFEEFIRDQAFSRIPMEEEELKEAYNAAKTEAMTAFSKKAVGQVAEEYIKELRLKMKTMYQQIKEENERESNQACQMFLQEYYSLIERKLRNKELLSFADYDNDVKNLQAFFLEQGPPGPFRRLIMSEFLQKAMLEASEFFQRGLSNELELQRTIMSEHVKNLESQLREIKSDHSKDKEMYEHKIRAIEIQKAELSAIETTLRENLERVQTDKYQAEVEHQNKSSQLKKELQMEIEEQRQRVAMAENKISDLHRKVFQTESENEKEKALYEQKIEFLERTIQDQQKKEQDVGSELKQQKREHQTFVRELQSKAEEQIKQLSIRLEETSEKFMEAQSKFEDLDQKYSFEKQKWEESQASMKNNMTLSQSQYNEMQRTIEELKTKSRSEVDRLTYELQDVKDQFRFKEDELIQLAKDREEELKSLKNQMEKETAIFNQKLEFKELSIQNLRSQLDESKKQHDAMVKAIENRAKEHYDGKENAQKLIEEIKEKHTLEIQELQKEIMNSRQAQDGLLETMNEKNNELELKYKLLKSDYDKETENLKSQLSFLEQQKQKAIDQSKSLDVQKLKLLEVTEERYKQQIFQLERDLEEKETKAQDEFRDLQQKSEESLQQLRNFYEIEKERLEHRLAEEKERVTKKFNQQQEEFDQRLRDEQQQHEEDIELLQEELRENERRYQAYQNQMEHENALMAQRIETMDSQIREKDERINKEQSITASQMETQLERFNNERKEHLAKIDQLNSTLNMKERENTILKNKLETAIEDADKRKKILEEQKTEFTNEKNKLNEKIEQLRNKNQELNDQYMQKKLEDGRELALYKQRLEFQQKKIDDLQKTNDEMYSKYDERIHQQKAEYQQEMQDTISKFNQQKEQLEQKYEQKRKQFKEIEQSYQRQIAEIQKERAVLDEKLINSELKKDEIKSKYEQEINFLKEQLQQAGESIFKDRESLISDNERLKLTLSDLEKEFSDISSNYERDKALYDGKFQFLESQRDQAKADLQEAHRKFEMTLEQLQKRGNSEKEKAEHSQNSLVSTLETKFKQQMKEAQEQNLKDKSDLQEKVKFLEKDNKQLQNKLMLEQKDKMSDHGSMQKKVQELIENESKLQREIDELKAERDRKIMDHQRALEKERETLKQKISDTETKCKELENKRSSMIFEFEKERARWSLEKDHFTNQKQEIQETVERLQKKNEDLLKENEKLKSDKGAMRKQYMYNATQGGASGAGFAGKYNGSMFGQHLLSKAASKENTTGGIATSQVFTSGFAKFIGDGISQSEKVDPHQLPLAMKEQNPNSFKSLLGSPNPSAFSLKGPGSGAGSYKSGMGKEATSTDETGSNS